MFAFAAAAAVVCLAYLPDGLAPVGVVCWSHLLGFPLGWVFSRGHGRVDWQLMLWELRRQERRDEHDEQVRARVDELLAKVSRAGMENLTRRERAFLRNASHQFRHWQETDSVNHDDRGPHE